MSDEDYLYHHGIKGMRWGVRHDRLKKRLSSLGTHLKRFGKTTADYVSKGKEVYKEKQMLSLKKKLATDRAKAQKNEQKMLRSRDTRKARQLALTTHDPKILYKNAHLLSDEELRERYNRLKLENEVHNLYIAKSTSGFNSFKKKADWAMSTPVAKAGLELGKKVAEKKLGLNNTSNSNLELPKLTSEPANRSDEAIGKARPVKGMKWGVRNTPSYSKGSTQIKIANKPNPINSKYNTIIKPNLSDVAKTVPVKVATTPKKSKKDKYSRIVKK